MALHDKALGHDEVKVGMGVFIRELAKKAKTEWTIEQWPEGVKDSVIARLLGIEPIAVYHFKGNIMLNEGLNELCTLIAGTGGTKWDNSNAYLGVGDSSVAENATHTGLQAATNKTWKGMNGGYPTYGSNQKITWQSDFADGDANYDWKEFTVVNASSDTGKNLNRKVASKGTKSGGTWTLTLDITWS